MAERPHDAITRTEPFQPTHIHKKGGLYRVLMYAQHTETQEELVIYESVHGTIHARPRWMFDDPDRFMPLPEGSRHIASFPPGTQFARFGSLAAPKFAVALPPGRPPVIIHMDGRLEEVVGGPITINEVDDSGPITIDIGIVGEEKPGD